MFCARQAVSGISGFRNINKDFETETENLAVKKDSIFHQALTIAWIALTIALTVSTARAQSRDSRLSPPATTNSVINHDAKPTNVSPASSNIEPAFALADFLDSFQGTNRPAALVFKPSPDNANVRVAEFTTASGVRLRAFANGPNQIRFVTVDQSSPLEMIFNGRNVVGSVSGNAGPVVEPMLSGLGALFAAVRNLVGGGTAGKKIAHCKTTITTTIDNGKVTSSVDTRCDIG